MDPPYWETAGYGVAFPFEEYERMVHFMRCCKGKVMVSINNYPDIRRVFDGFHFETLDIRYDEFCRSLQVKVIDVQICSGLFLITNEVGWISLKNKYAFPSRTTARRKFPTALWESSRGSISEPTLD